MKTLGRLRVHIFFVIFEVHHMVIRHNVCSKEYMDLPLRLVSGTTSGDTKSMRRRERSESQKKKLK